MKHLKHFNESIGNLNWSNINLEYVINEYNRIFNKIGFTATIGKKYFNYNYIDNYKIEIEDLLEIEHSYDNLQDGLITDIKDECKNEIDIELKWIGNRKRPTEKLDLKCKRFQIIMTVVEISNLKIFIDKLSEHNINLGNDFMLHANQIIGFFEI